MAPNCTLGGDKKLKEKNRSKVNIGKEIRFAASKMLLRFDVLCHGKEEHESS
jgi:hypothetical protein